MSRMHAKDGDFAVSVPKSSGCQPASADLLAQHERALSLLCGLHQCVTIDGPPEAVAQRIFDQVIAEQAALRERIASLEKSLDYFRAMPPTSDKAGLLHD